MGSSQGKPSYIALHVDIPRSMVVLDEKFQELSSFSLYRFPFVWFKRLSKNVVIGSDRYNYQRTDDIKLPFIVVDVEKKRLLYKSEPMGVVQVDRCGTSHILVSEKDISYICTHSFEKTHNL